MSKLIEIIVLACFGVLTLAASMAVLLVAAPILSGAAGWVFSMVFNDTFEKFMQWSNMGMTGFEFGAMLGFVSIFFAARSASKSKS